MEYHVQAFREPQTDEEREFANPFIQVELLLLVVNSSGDVFRVVEQKKRTCELAEWAK